LLASVHSSKTEIQCYNGETRSRIYLTGLRRAEIGSLTPTSFDLEGDPATLTIEALNSKHRRKDILPLHPDLVRVLPGWLEDIPADQPLFPRLAKRRTWLMVKKDLERAGIPYETEEGTADFHAVGRHTYITELLRNGASLVEARELARHSDIKHDDAVHPHRPGRPGQGRCSDSRTRTSATSPGRHRILGAYWE